jgi:pyruvate oxidase
MNAGLQDAIVERDVAHLIFPDEVQTLPAPRRCRPAVRPGGSAIADAARRPTRLASALQMLKDAKRRSSCRLRRGGRMDEIVALAEKLGAPVVTTFKGKGLIADRSPNAAGVLGRSGTPIASWFMNEMRSDARARRELLEPHRHHPKKPIIQVDFDAMHARQVPPVDCRCWGEIGLTAPSGCGAAARDTGSVDQRPELAERWRIWRDEKAGRRGSRSRQGRQLGAACSKALSRLVPADAVIAGRRRQQHLFLRPLLRVPRPAGADVGLSRLDRFRVARPRWAPGRRPRSTRLPRPQGDLDLSGDGGFGQYMAEFTTAVHYGMAITHVLLNNDELGKISKEQRAGQWPVWQTGLRNPDFAAYASSCGGLGIRVEHEAELEDALRRAIAHDGPALVEVLTDAELI